MDQDKIPPKAGPTATLAKWATSLRFEEIPDSIRTRAKYLILDGLACGLIGAHLPWSEIATNVILDLEPQGDSALFGWGGRKVTALSSALINSSYIQGFELDDWHSEAPLHSNSIILPALLAVAQHLQAQGSSTPISGPDLLLATITGYEVGPRIGQALYGSHILSTGWHSGAVFGPPTAAIASSKLLRLDQDKTEAAIGIACTQACGLMSAQFESEVKRMQHGFAARNGLLAAFLARGGYTGIKNVFERDYGGYLKQFSSGNGKNPQYREEELIRDLGIEWQTANIRIKPYASMAGTHSTIDCVRELQKLHPVKMQHTEAITKICITLGEAAFHHGGWKATRPLTTTGAHMSNSYAAATQLIHGQVLPPQFRSVMLEDNRLWRLVDLTDCQQTDEPHWPKLRQSVSIEFEDGTSLSHIVDAALGVQPALSNDDIVAKWDMLTKDVVDRATAEEIKETILSLEKIDDISRLHDLLSVTTMKIIA